MLSFGEEPFACVGVGDAVGGDVEDGLEASGRDCNIMVLDWVGVPLLLWSQDSSTWEELR